MLSLFPLISAQVFESVQETSSSSEAGFQYVSALFVGTSALLVGVGFLLFFKWTKVEKLKSSLPSKRKLTTIKKDFKIGDMVKSKSK